VLIFKSDGSSWWAISPGGAFYIALVVSVVTAAWGVLEAGRIRSEHITILSSKIPESIDRVRIVQISDVHLGLIVREGRLEKILRKVKEAEPDVLVSTGDLVDGQTNDLSKMAEMIRKIPAKYGKFAVTGNHEYYAGLSRSLAFTEAAGFSILRGKGIQVGGLIQVVGVDDPAGKRFGLKSVVAEEDLLSGLKKQSFTLLLKHRPLVNQKSSGLFDLQLSGHAHKGQIFPFSLIIKMLYPIDAGLLALEKGGYLYVSRGTGTWGPPMRFLAPPEVTVIDLVHLEEKSSSWQS
jgi:predicted MPP superfamily phosphohydrolase